MIGPFVFEIVFCVQCFCFLYFWNYILALHKIEGVNFSSHWLLSNLFIVTVPFFSHSRLVIFTHSSERVNYEPLGRISYALEAFFVTCWESSFASIAIQCLKGNVTSSFSNTQFPSSWPLLSFVKTVVTPISRVVSFPYCTLSPYVSSSPLTIFAKNYIIINF